MNFNDILNGVLKSVGNTANQGKTDLGGMLGSVLNSAKNSAAEIKAGNTDTITKVGGGAALMGILSMVLGRNGGANLTKLGSLAVLGSMAYKAYQDYQSQQANKSEVLNENAFEVSTQNEQNSAVILRTMIAAALSDGHLDENELALIQREGGDAPEFQQWLEQEIRQPISVAEIASLVGNDTALATQVYLAARVVCQDLSRKEIVFLAQLAEALKLDEELVAQLEKQAGF